VRRLRTTTQSLTTPETDRPASIPTAREQKVARPCFLLRADPASEKLGITSCLCGSAVGLLKDDDQRLVLIG